MVFIKTIFVIIAEKYRQKRQLEVQTATEYALP